MFLNRFIDDLAAKKDNYSNINNLSFAIFAVFTFIMPYFMWSSSQSGHQSILILLRLIAGLMSVALIIVDFLPIRSKRFCIIFWYLTILYCLPFLTTYVFLLNPQSLQWLLNTILSLLLLAILLDWKSFAIILPLGLILAYIAYCVTLQTMSLPFGDQYSYIYIYMFLFTALISGIFVRNKESYQKKLVTILETKVNERTQHLENALMSRNEFLNNISHEVRTPIHAVTAISEGLLENWDAFNDSQKKNYVKELVFNSERLYNLVNDILDLSKLNSGKLNFNFHLNDLNEIVENTIQECKPFFTNKKITIKTELCANLPKFICDNNRISQVIRNLLSNAIKFTEEYGEVILKTDYHTDHSGQEIYFEIRDDGIGIPHNEIHSIFESFIQSSATKTGAGGTGLGLSICKEIILGHGGKIWAESDDNGSVFKFFIPQIDVNTNFTSKDHNYYKNKFIELDKIKLPQKNNYKKSTIEHVKKYDILIIDDEDVCLNSLELMLYNRNFNIIKANGGKQGLEILNQRHVDLILLDLMMPDIYGINILIEIKNNVKLSNIPIIIQTGSSDKDEINRAYAIGANDCIYKPYSRQKVLDSINNIINKN